MIKSNTFCIYPWIHMYVEPGGDVYPCCASGHDAPLGNTQTNTIEEIWNSKEYKNLRLDMLNGVKRKECLTCYRMEDNKVKSIRQKKLEEFSHLIELKDTTNDDGSLDQITLKHFDVRWSNICNFKCRTCYSNLSSSIAKEEVENYNQSIPIYRLAGGDTNDNLFDQFKPYLSNIETFYFAGGEPLITDKHYEILEHLIKNNHTNCKLQYDTNFSTLQYKNKSLFELWKHFPDISIRASFDSYGRRAEYIREGTVWQIIEQNMKKLSEEVPHVRLNTTTVVSILNVSSLIDFLDYMLNTEFYTPKNFYPQFYNIQNPEYYSANAIDPSTKKQVLEKLYNNLEKYTPQVKSQIHNVISWLESSQYNPQLKQEFKRNIIEKDTIRQKNILDYIPELKNYIETE